MTVKYFKILNTGFKALKRNCCQMMKCFKIRDGVLLKRTHYIFLYSEVDSRRLCTEWMK